jgi:hypothetical protein
MLQAELLARATLVTYPVGHHGTFYTSAGLPLLSSHRGAMGFKKAWEQGYTATARRKGLMDFSSSFSSERPLFLLKARLIESRLAPFRLQAYLQFAIVQAALI